MMNLVLATAIFALGVVMMIAGIIFFGWVADLCGRFGAWASDTTRAVLTGGPYLW